MQFEFEPTALIKAVEKRPVLWDTQCIEHKVLKKRSASWSEVVTELVDTSNISKSDRTQIEYQLQKKWKGLRDSYLKYLHSKKKKKRPYRYASVMKFLQKESGVDHLTDSENETNQEKSDTQATVSWKKKAKISFQYDSTDEENVNAKESNDTIEGDTYDNDNDFVPVEEAVNSKMEPNDATYNDFEFANVEIVPTEETNDSDRLFLLSLLPHLATVPQQFKLSVKMELLQVLQSAHFNYNNKR